MKISLVKHIRIGDVTPDRLLRLDALVNILQEAAIEHSRRVGIQLNSLLDSGRTWVLSRLVIDIVRLPRLDETVEVCTWSRSIQRFKGFREFTFAIDGSPIASASTLWLYLDLAKGRPLRVPEHYESLYGTEPELTASGDIGQWTPPDTVEADSTHRVTTRLSDLDVNGHVNNAVVLQYIQTAQADTAQRERKIRAVKLAFLKEIPAGVREIEVAMQENGSHILLQVRRNETVFVTGAIETENQ